jgi:hypothetical protein
MSKYVQNTHQNTHNVRNTRDDSYIVTSAPTLAQLEIQCAITHTLWALSLSDPSCADCAEMEANGYLYLTSVGK